MTSEWDEIVLYRLWLIVYCVECCCIACTFAIVSLSSIIFTSLLTSRSRATVLQTRTAICHLFVALLGLVVWLAAPFRVVLWRWMGQTGKQFRIAASTAFIANAVWALVVFIVILVGSPSRLADYPNRFMVFEVRLEAFKLLGSITNDHLESNNWLQHCDIPYLDPRVLIIDCLWRGISCSCTAVQSIFDVVNSICRNTSTKRSMTWGTRK
jgi:hypothetical protein